MADDWVFIKIRFSGHREKFQTSKIQQYIQNKIYYHTLRGYETNFGINLNQKDLPSEFRRIQTFKSKIILTMLNKAIFQTGSRHDLSFDYDIFY